MTTIPATMTLDFRAHAPCCLVPSDVRDMSLQEDRIMQLLSPIEVFV
jgi:hypothetical protein